MSSSKKNGESTKGSVSKGVFAFRGTKKRANADNFYRGNEDGLSKGCRDLCDHLWENMKTQLNVLEQGLNTKIYDELIQYVLQAHSTLGENGEPKRVYEIPTAALVTGVNMPDHALMFANLVRLLKESASPHVASLRSKDCPNIKSVIAKLLSQIMQQDVEDEDDELAPCTKRISSTLSVLAAWYKQHSHRTAHLKKASRKRPGSPMKSPPSKRPASPKKSSKPFAYSPIVVILEDLEGFPPHVLQDFVTICSNHLSDLPLVLVFGIATAVTTLHRFLPAGVSALMCIEKFQAPPSSEYLTKVIENVVMTVDFPFKLGEKVFTLLLDLFLFHDFSVLNFISGLQFALLDHCYSHPYSILCKPHTEAIKQLQNLKPKSLQCIKEIPSVVRYFEGKSDKERQQIQEDDNFTKRLLTELLHDLDTYHKCVFPILHCLHVCTSILPRYPLGKQIREMYAMCLASNICDSDEYKECIILLRSLSRDELYNVLQKCALHLQASCLPEKEFSEFRSQFASFLIRLDNVEELSWFANQDDKEEEESFKNELPAPKKFKLHDLRQQLQEMEKKKKKLTLYEVLRNEIIDLLDILFRKYLLSPSSFPLHEVFYYNNAADIRKHLNASPRATIQRALADPYSYLQADALLVEGDFISHTLPDLCIVYKLHLECGRLINLYDWLQAFAMIIHSGEEDEENAPQQRPIDKTLQARFIRAVSELQFLGFIKSTKRKTDHVARLTWGGC